MSSTSATALPEPARSARSRLSALGARLLADTPVGWRELGLAGVFLLIVGFAVFLPHIEHGNRYWADDWLHTRLVAQPDGPAFWDTVNQQTGEFRPLLVTLIALPYHWFGFDPSVHLSLAVVLAAATSLTFFWLLRVLGLQTLHAAIIATLVLLFPFSDSSRLWTTGSILQWALIFYFLGTVLSLYGLRTKGWRLVVLTAGGLTLYVASILTYEIVAVAEVASVLLYAYQSGWGKALRRWPFDLVAVGVTLNYVYTHIPERYKTHPTPRAIAGHGRDMADDGLTLFNDTIFPGVFDSRVIGLFVIAVVVGAAVVIWRRLAPADETRRALARWLLIGLAGGALIVAGYLPFVPGKATYLPGNPGVDNRVNLLAAFGWVIVAYAVVMLAGTLLARALKRGPAFAAGFAAVASLGIAIGYLVILDRDIDNWDRAAKFQRRELAVIGHVVPAALRDVRATGPKGPGKITVYAFGSPTYVAPSVPVFALRTDLRDGVRLTLNERHLAAYPVRKTDSFATRWICEQRYMYPKDVSMGRHEGVPYGRGIFVDIPSAVAVIPRTRAQCATYARRFGHKVIVSKALGL